MKYVTFYYSIFDGIEDFMMHKNKETARKYFLKHYKEYFSLSGCAIPSDFKMPYSYGYFHRKYYVMSEYKYNQFFVEEVNENNNK